MRSTPLRSVWEAQASRPDHLFYFELRSGSSAVCEGRVAQPSRGTLRSAVQHLRLGTPD